MWVCVCTFGYGLAVDYKETLNAINAKKKNQKSWRHLTGKLNLQRNYILRLYSQPRILIALHDLQAGVTILGDHLCLRRARPGSSIIALLVVVRPAVPVMVMRWAGQLPGGNGWHCDRSHRAGELFSVQKQALNGIQIATEVTKFAVQLLGVFPLLCGDQIPDRQNLLVEVVGAGLYLLVYVVQDFIDRLLLGLAEQVGRNVLLKLYGF